MVAPVAGAATTTLTDAHGHSVEFVSSAPPQTPEQQFADVLFGLVHGAEMDALTVHLNVTEQEHRDACGDAAGCYSHGLNPGTLYVRAFDVNEIGDPIPYTPQEMPRGLIAHEYGHHVSAHRVNDGPLEGGGLANGTKRWASYVGVCPGVRAGALAVDYPSWPGEGFAEAYRSLHFPENLNFWFMHPQYKPDQRALDLIREDVVNPYSGPTRVKAKGKFKARGKGKQRKRLETPLDGELTASLKTKGSLRAKLAVLVDGKRVAKGKGRKQELTYEVCGARQIEFEVKRKRGKGRYTVKAARP